MPNIAKKKGERGVATKYITKGKAMKKLQVSWQDFRRLCILKGVYPHEPNHKKKVNKGSTENKVWYSVRDIRYLLHEPIINKFRYEKTFMKKVNRYKRKQMTERVERFYENKPEYTLDRIIKERYPTFGSALRDMDDPLCMVFLFATFQSSKVVKAEVVQECRRLSSEFMHYVIESHSLFNTFISIKGIYYQAIICGEKVTWVVPHERGVGEAGDVDFQVMATFTDFYIALLEFVNYKLYQMLGLFYPPRIHVGEEMVELTNDQGKKEEHIEKVYSLCRPLARRVDAEEKDDEEIDSFEDDDGLAERMKEAKQIKTLFKNMTFFINRECPKEALALIIRNCGGQVTWENAPNEIAVDSPQITHQIVDRPVQMDKVNVNRIYVQPQWVFDTLNARRRLPSQKYLPGQTLPPHFSPFVKEKPGDYIPVERIEELRIIGKDVAPLEAANPAPMPDLGDGSRKVLKQTLREKRRKEEEEKGMNVKLGRMHRKIKQVEVNTEGEDLKLREMMLPKKRQRAYQKVKKSIRKTGTEQAILVKKRKVIEAQKAAKFLTGEQ